MAEPTDVPAPLSPEEATRVTDFARACKAAARAVTLYPPAHPAIAATLDRIVQATSTATMAAPLKLTVLPGALLFDGRAPERPDQAIAELASLLHAHVVGELTVQPGGDVEDWRNFLLLLGRTPESVRAEGGFARLWTTMAGRHVDVREIDYAALLRERPGGESAVWESVIANCLQGDAASLDNETIRELLAIAGDSGRLGTLMSALEACAGEGTGGIGTKTSALLKMFHTIIDAVSKGEPERLDPVLRNIATAVGQLSPDTLVGILSHGAGEAGDAGDETRHLVRAVVSRMSETTIARFVARNVIADGTPTDRLAQAFQTLVPDTDERQRLLALAHDEVAISPLGLTEKFQGVWNHVTQKLLASYSDESYVSGAYGRELSGARTQAIQVEQVNDDPPERFATWLSTISTSALRVLDVTLLLDLLRIEEDDERRDELMPQVVSLIEDLLLVGDFEAAAKLLAVLVQEAGSDGPKARRQSAIVAIDMVAAGSMLRYVVTHLATIDVEQFECLKGMCVSLGEVMVRPIAEALSTEENSRTRERLTAIMIAFGTVGRRTVERLKNSPNAAVRRIAIVLLRQYGGSESLPDLTELLDDSEPQVQREAVRAILSISTDRAYRVLQLALAGGTTRSRGAIMQSIVVLRDERTLPLFTYIIRHIDHRGPLAAIYLRAIESLGALRDPDGVAPLKEALYRGEWWAPRRTAAIRTTAAAALARIGTSEAFDALDDAIASGPRGVRAAARAYRPKRAAATVNRDAG